MTEITTKPISSTTSSAQILDSIDEHSRACSIGICHEHTFYFIHVHKAKGEAELEIENPLYTVDLDRTKGTRLGLKLEVQVATRSLFIKEVVGGLAFSFNAQQQKNKVKPGDRIVRVNNIEGDANLMLDECKKCQALQLELHRGTAIPIMPGLSATVRKGFGNLIEGQEGTVTKIDEEGDALMQIKGIGNQWVCKQDYDKFMFEDSNRFVFKRFCDFKDLVTNIQAKIDKGTETPIKALPNIPHDEHFGFRRQLSSMGMSNFMAERKEGLQRLLNAVLAQVSSLEDEPLLADFFGAHPIPSVGVAKEDILKQRLDMLIMKHQPSLK